MNRPSKDFWEENWKTIVAFIYVVLILSLGVIVYHAYTSPPEDDYGKYSIRVIVKNDSKSSKFVTIVMESNTVMADDISYFENKTIPSGEKGKFTVKTNTVYTNIPFTLKVCHPDEIDDPLVTKEIRLYTDGSHKALFYMKIDRSDM